MTTEDAVPCGEMHLERMLAGLAVDVQPGTFTYVTDDVPIPTQEVSAMIREPEGTTLVLEVETARAHGIPPGFEAAWLTVRVHSSLEAVGLTAALSAALAASGIPCNVLAGFFHDHLLVPVHRSEEALEALDRLRRQNSGLV
ncbi:MAG: ACT domain-containing protein [Acidimicrobiales bacterium]|nr:ACT domain-containing protein [Acidimicrobiales bacterium]